MAFTGVKFHPLPSGVLNDRSKWPTLWAPSGTERAIYIYGIQFLFVQIQSEHRQQNLYYVHSIDLIMVSNIIPIS